MSYQNALKQSVAGKPCAKTLEQCQEQSYLSAWLATNCGITEEVLDSTRANLTRLEPNKRVSACRSRIIHNKQDVRSSAIVGYFESRLSEHGRAEAFRLGQI